MFRLLEIWNKILQLNGFRQSINIDELLLVNQKKFSIWQVVLMRKLQLIVTSQLLLKWLYIYYYLEYYYAISDFPLFFFLNCLRSNFSGRPWWIETFSQFYFFGVEEVAESFRLIKIRLQNCSCGPLGSL